MYITAIIRTEAMLNRYCNKRWAQEPTFCETIGHIGEATIEKAYLQSPTDERYTDYYLLYMESPKGNTANLELLRSNFYDLVRTGKATLLTV